MDDRERFIHENALIDAIADDCAASRARIAAEEARMLRRMADAWGLAQEQISRIDSGSSRRREMPLRSISSQIAFELHLNDRTVQTKLHNASRLVNAFAHTVEALERGQISKAHADVMLDLGGVLDDVDVRAAFEEVVLEWAEHETVGRTRAYARQLAEKLDPRSMAERHADAVDERSITLVDLDNGMSQIIALLPTAEAHGIYDRLTRQAKAVREIDIAAAREAALADRAAREAALADEARRDAELPAEPADEAAPCEAGVVRPISQTRADIFMDTLLTGAPHIDPTRDKMRGGLGAIQGHVQLMLPVTALTGVSQGGIEIDGCAPIDPLTAKRLAGNTAIWDRVMFDPVRAVVVAVDRYKQTPAQERFLRARDRHCRAPGCRRPAIFCQIDHNHERHEGGPTSICNLACFCVRHHTMKTETEWTVRQLDNGRLEFSSPSGRTYVDKPAPLVAFTPDLDPAPF